MHAVERHAFESDASFDGGDLDCGNGLLLLIRQHIDPLEQGQLLEFRSTVGVGVVNQKYERVEPAEEILARAADVLRKG